MWSENFIFTLNGERKKVVDAKNLCEVESISEEDFESKYKQARDFIKEGQPEEAITVLNSLHLEQLSVASKARVFYELSRCYDLKKNYIFALSKIEKAIEFESNNPTYHWFKSLYLFRDNEKLDSLESAFNALKCVENGESREHYCSEILVLSRNLFSSFSAYHIKIHEFSQSINCLQYLIDLDIVPKDFREKYMDFRKECIIRLKTEIYKDALAIVPGTGSPLDEFYDNKLSFCKQFLKIENISDKEKMNVINEYAKIKSEVRCFYGYKLSEDFSKIDDLCKTGDIVLEKGDITRDCLKTDLVTGVIFHEGDNIFLVDAYEYEYSNSINKYEEYNGWRLASYDELQLLYSQMKEINFALGKITGATSLLGEYKGSDSGVVVFGNIKNSENNGPRTRFIRRIG